MEANNAILNGKHHTTHHNNGTQREREKEREKSTATDIEAKQEKEVKTSKVNNQMEHREIRESIT